MHTLEEYLQSLEDEKVQKLSEVIVWIQQNFPQLYLTIKWNQPVFTDHDTYIIGFSVSKKHFSIAPEKKILDVFRAKIIAANMDVGANLYRISWNDQVDYSLLENIISYTVKIKQGCKTFWLK